MSDRKTTETTTAESALDRLFRGGVALSDGAMGTMLYGRGIGINRCYEELNLLQPETIASVHTEYMEAGAEMIESNTFGANAYRLERHGLGGKVREINLAGVRIARERVARIAQKQAEAVCVAGAVGPLGIRLKPLGTVGLGEARAAFTEQIRALAEGGPGVGADLLIIETMMSLAEAGEAIGAAQQTAPGLRIVVMMTVDEEGICLDGTSPETAAARLTELGADAVGCNCSDGPATVLRVIERMRTATHLPLAAMPNAGIPHAVEGGSVYYTVSPECMAGFVPKFIRAGANLIGGCCGTTPSYTRAMKFAASAAVALDGGLGTDSDRLWRLGNEVGDGGF